MKAIWKIIFNTGTLMEVYAAKNYLESEGIEVLLQNEFAAQVYGNAVDKAKLLVKEIDFDKANEFLLKGGYIK